MTMINLDYVQFYQLPVKADLANKPSSMASVNDVPVVCEERYAPMVSRSSNELDERIEKNDLIEVLDLTGPSEYPLDLSYKQAPNLKGTELCAEGSSNKLDLSGCGGEEDENLPSVKELLLDFEGAQESQRTGLRLDGAKSVNTDSSSSSVYSRSDGSTSETGEKHYSLGPLRISVAGSEAECSILRKKTEDPISDPPPPLPTMLLSSIHDTHICIKDIKHHHSDGGKEKGNKGASCSTNSTIPHSLRSPIARWSPTQFTEAEPETTTGTINIRGSSKRTADSAGLNESREDMHRLKKAQRADPIMIDDTDTDDDMNDPVEHRRILSLAQLTTRPVSGDPLEQRFHQMGEFKLKSIQRNNPFVVEDDEQKTDETGDSTRATSMESEIGIVPLQSSHSREQSKTHGCLSSLTITEPTASPLGHPIPLNVLSSRGPVEQTIRGGDREAAAIVIPLLPEQPQNKDVSVLYEDEWEIVRIVDKRWTENGYEYQVCWKNTWLPKSELGNAQQLMQQFETKHQAQRGGKRGRPARADDGW